MCDLNRFLSGALKEAKRMRHRIKQIEVGRYGNKITRWAHVETIPIVDQMIRYNMQY